LLGPRSDVKPCQQLPYRRAASLGSKQKERDR
jgi:hypothetical protein